MINLTRLLVPERIVWLESQDKSGVVRELCQRVVEPADEADLERVHRAVMERERLLSTGIGLGLAIPHAIVDFVPEYRMALGIHRTGVPYEALDELPVHVLALIVGPEGKRDNYLKILARTARFLKNHKQDILACDDPAAIHELTRDY